MCQVRYIAEIIVCVDSASNIIFQLEEVRSQGIRTLIQNQVRTCVDTCTDHLEFDRLLRLIIKGLIYF